MQQVFTDSKAKAATNAVKAQKDHDDYAQSFPPGMLRYNMYEHRLAAERVFEQGYMREYAIKAALGKAAQSNKALTDELLCWCDHLFEEICDVSDDRPPHPSTSRGMVRTRAALPPLLRMLLCTNNPHAPPHVRAQRKLKSIDPSVKPINGKSKLKA